MSPLRRAVLPTLAGALLVLLSPAIARAQTWQLKGPPVFEPSVNGQPALLPGQTFRYDDGEGGITSTMVARSPTSVEITTSQPRYGTHRMTYTWDTPPQTLRAGELVPVAVRWNITQKWTRFAPQMGSLAHLDWSADWYTTQMYGELAERNGALSQATGAVANDTVRVTAEPGNRGNNLSFYWHLHCGGVFVRVRWDYVPAAAAGARRGAPVPMPVLAPGPARPSASTPTPPTQPSTPVPNAPIRTGRPPPRH